MENTTAASRSNPLIKKVLAATFPSYKGRKITVRDYTGPQRFTVCWDEGSKDDIRLLTIDGRSADLVAGSPWQNPEGVLALVDQPAGTLLVVLTHAGTREWLTIYVRQPEASSLGAAPVAGLLA
jgi:hypothetical protein